MKTIFKRASKSTLAVVLTLCLLFSCMTVGIMSTSAASVDYVDDWTQQAQKDVAAGAQAVYDASVGASAGESVGAISQISLRGSFNGWSSTDHTATSFPASWDISLTASTEYEFKVVFVENGDHYCGITTNNDGTYSVSDLGTAKQLYWGQGGNVHFTPTTTGTYTFKVTTSGGNNYITITKKAETTYSVSVTAGTGGTVASNSVNAGATTAVTLPTATAKLGYKFKNWTASGGGVSITSPTSANAAKITATSTGGTVTANFEENTSLEFFISGRFRVKASDSATTYTNTYDGTGDWADNCEKSALKLTRSGAYTYTLDTHCTMKELSAQIGGGSYQGDQVFYVHDKTNSKNYFAGSGKTFTSTSGDNVTLVTSGGSNSNLKFSSDNENGYVVLSFNPTTMKLSYTIRGAKTALAAPTGLKLGGMTGNQTVDAAQGQNIALSWTAVSNAASYTVYKGSTKVAENITTTSYDIEKSYANGGTYTVVAYPASGSTTYMESAASADITLTVNRVKLATPTVATNKESYISGDTVTFTLSGSTGTVGTTFKYQRKAPSDSSYSNLANNSSNTFTTGALNAGTYDYKFKAVSLLTNYFSDSDEVTKSVTVVAPTTTLYVKDDLGYLYAYIWKTGSTSTDLQDWAGEQMTTDTDWTHANGYYKREFTEDWGSFSVILNNNSDSNKTNDSESKAVGGTYRIDSLDGNNIIFTEGAPLPQLAAPSITMNGGTSDVTINAERNGKVTLAWSAVTNAGSYEIYKGDTLVDTVTTTSYQIEKGNSYSGTYKVVAVPSTAAASSYSKSPASNAIKLTVNKVALAQPTIELNKNAVNNTDTGVTVTVTNYNALKDACTFTLSGVTVGGSQSNISNTGVFSITGYNSSASNGANNNITVTAAITSGNTDYYSIANGTSTAAVLKVYKPDFALCGDVNKVTSTGITTPSDGNWNSKSAFVIESTTQTPGVYSLVFTTTSDAYLGLRNTSSRYNVKVDGTSYNTYDKSYTIPNEGKSGMELIQVSDGSMKFAAGKTYTITVNQTNNTVSVSTDSWNVTTTARYKDYDVATGSYKAVANGTTGGTVSPATVSVKKGQSTTLTATAASGYTFTGWFTAEACTGTPVSTAASYSVTPAADTTYYALFTKNEPAKVNISVANVSGATISATWNGTTATNGQTLSNVPVGAQVSVTVTPADNKYVDSTTPALTNGKFTVTASTTSITATLADKSKITATSNNPALGTVSVATEYAIPGETVTISYTATTGICNSIAVYTNTTKIKEWTRDSKGDLKVTTAQVSSPAASFLFGNLNKIAKILKDKAGESVGADDALTFTMPSSAVNITATYTEYVGTSEYIYHGRNTSGQAVSGYEAEPMSEGIINGQKYAYYNVTGREGVGYDQLFYISKGGSTEGRYVYFTANGETYGDWYLPYGTNTHAYFFNSSGAVGTAWPGAEMTWVSDGNDNDKNSNWKIAIPAGATGVIFTNGKSGGDFKQTHDINLTNTNGSYYPSGYSSNKYEVTQWTTPGENSGIIAGTDYYWDTDVYTDQWWTGGFSNHNVNNDHNYAKPKNGGNDGTGSWNFDDYKSDYYIVVLYPNTTYKFSVPGGGDHDNHQQTVGAKPMVLWMAQLPGQTATASATVKVYAKDGAIRRKNNNYGSGHNGNNITYSYFEQHANTFVYSDSGYASHIGTRSSNDGQSSEGSSGYNGYTYDYVAKFEKGDTLYIKTLLDSTLMENHYLVAYSINGKCYKLHTDSESNNGYVTEEFTVPEDWEDNYVEITPIYFPKDASNCITFYIEGYDQTVMDAGWGNTPFVYPFYQDQNYNYVGNINNAFGGYPGQPMVFYQGNYYTMLPKEYTTIPEGGGDSITCKIKGVTLGNGYWDDIHYKTGEVSSHFQTYDYDDLYKIYTEHPTEAKHIICSFKYRTKKNNDEPGDNPTFSNYNSTNGNGWEVLTDYYGRPVDVFGTALTGDALTTANNIMNGTTLAENATAVHIISQDYKSNSAGEYGTEWAIYNTSGNKVVTTGTGAKTTIVPSVLAITDTEHFTNYDAATRAFQGIYNVLKADSNVVGKPAVITYEKSIYGGSDKADRCDARWAFSTTGQPITATVKIEYTDDGKNWLEDTFTSGTGTGSTTGTKAYFTGKASSAVDTPTDTTGISEKNTTLLSGTTGGGYYTFKAENNGQYQFVGWYLLRDNYQNISVRSSYDSAATEFASHAQQSKNGDIFVARFKKTATGTFDIYHELHPQTTGYGHVYVEAIVKDSVGTQQGSKLGSIDGGTLTDKVTIPNTYITSGSGYKIEAKFKAVAYPTSQFVNFYATPQSLLNGFTDYNYIDSISINNNIATVVYDVDKLFSYTSGSPVQTVTNVTHYSMFSLRTDLHYNLEYTFNTRYYGTKLYKYTNKNFTENELRSYFREQIENPATTTITLDKQFVQSKAPFESNYREDLTWVVDNVTFDNNVGKLTATQVPIKWAKATVYDFTDAGVMSTTTMEAPLEKLFDKTVESKPTDASEATTAITNWDTTCTDDDLYTTIRTSYNDGNTTVPLYLHHWEVYQLDSFTYKTNSDGSPKMKEDGFNLDIDTGKSKLVCLTYSTKFNYIGYEDYAIVPVYTTDLMSTPERQAISNSRTDSSATLLTITRNHWNTTVSGTADSGKYGEANKNYDRLYVDFMLNYNYKHNDQNILLSSTGNNIKVGFLVKSYTIEYTEENGQRVGHKVYRTKATVIVDKSSIDNKNRLEYCYGFNNTRNNSQYGLNFEFTPFIIDTTEGVTGAGSEDITLPSSAGGGTYRALYADSTVSVLDGVNFYMIGKADTDWAES